MNTRRHIVQLVVVLIVLAAGLGVFRLLAAQREELAPSVPERPLPRVEVVRAVRSSVTPLVHAWGSVVPRTRTELIAEVPGRVIEVAEQFSEGGFFEPGQVLVELEKVDLEAAVAGAVEQVANAELLLAQEQADADLSRRDWELDGGGEASALTLREPQLRRALAALASARAQLGRAERDLERATIRAPYAGRVKTTSIDRGSWVSRGAHVASVYAIDIAEVRLPLSDQDLACLDLPLAWADGERRFEGPRATLRARLTGREHAWPARIVRTQAELDPMTRMLVCVAEVVGPYAPREGEPAPLHAGLFVDAEIEGAPFEAFALPRLALLRALRSDAAVHVFVPEGDSGRGRLEVREVRVQRSEAERTFVTAGLSEGELVVVSTLEAAVDGMFVQLAEPLSPAGAGSAEEETVGSTAVGSR